MVGELTVLYIIQVGEGEASDDYVHFPRFIWTYWRMKIARRR